MLLSLLSTSGTMAGLSLALVGIVNLRITSTKVASIADDVFLFASLGFVVVCYMTFFCNQACPIAAARAADRHH